MFWLEENLILSNVLFRGESSLDDKYVEKSVQPVRGSSFRNDLLQNPYFSNSPFERVMEILVIFE